MADMCDLHRKEEKSVIRSDKQIRREKNNCRPRYRRKDNNESETTTTKIWDNMLWLRARTSGGFLRKQK